MVEVGSELDVLALNTLRRALRFTIVELADLFDVSDQHLRHILSGRKVAGPHVIARIRGALSQSYYRDFMELRRLQNPIAEATSQHPVYVHRKQGPRCYVEGLPLALHARCLVCLELVGPGHTIGEVDGTGICPSCKRALKARLEVR